MSMLEALPAYLADRAVRVQPSKIREIAKLIAKPGIKSLAGGMPDPAIFPVQDIRDAFDRMIDGNAKLMLQYGTSEGYLPLREFLSTWLARFTFKSYTPDELMLTHGAQQAMDLIARTFVNEGDAVIVGLPTFFGATNAFLAAGAEIIGTPEDDHGMDPVVLARTLRYLKDQGKRVKLLYVIPSFANPTGRTIPLERRKQILALAQEHNCLVVEDDPYVTLRYSGEALPSLAALDTDGRVIHAFSFSKVLVPGFRIATLAGDAALIRRMVITKQYVDACCNTPSHYVLYDLLTRGVVDRMIRDNVAHYAQKRDWLLAAMEAHFPKEVHWNFPDGGFFVMVDLPDSLVAEDLFQEALKRNVAFVPGEPFYCDGGGKHSLRLTFSMEGRETLIEGVRILGDLLKEKLGVKV